MGDNLIQISMAALGSVAFAIFFNVKKTKLPAAAIGAVIAWVIYLYLYNRYSSIFVANFLAALGVCFYAEIMARVLKAPANIFLVPSIIPLLPGGSFYYTMAAIVSKDFYLFYKYGMETIVSVISITIGVTIGFFAMTQIMKCYNFFTKKHI